MSKRTFDYQSIYLYEINISKLDISQEYKESYLKTYLQQIQSKLFEVKTIWQFLFSNELPKLKYALYLLSRFISVQLESNSNSTSHLFLSRNDFALVNLICSLIRHNDAQVKYTSLWCLLNLTLYPKIEERIYTPENLNHIYQALKESDFALLPVIIDIIRNCCVNRTDNSIYFIKNNILSSYCVVLKHKDTNEELKIKILKCVSVISKGVLEDTSLLKEFRNIIVSLTPLYSQMQTLETSFDFIYLLLSNITTNAGLFDILITFDLVNNLFNMFNNKQNNKQKEILYLIITFLSGSDSITQILLDHGILNLLKSSLVDFAKDKTVLTDVVWGIANLFGGTLGQCEQAEASGILIDVMELGKKTLEELKTMPSLQNNNNLFMEILYVISNCSTGSSVQTKINLLQFDDGLVIKMIVYGLTQFQTNSDMILLLLSTIREYIILEENMMADLCISKAFLNENIESILNQLFGREKNERNLELIEILLSSLNN